MSNFNYLVSLDETCFSTSTSEDVVTTAAAGAGAVGRLIGSTRTLLLSDAVDREGPEKNININFKSMDF